jgi:hypothetical protein
VGKARNPAHGLHRQVISTHPVQDHHVERSRRSAFLIEATDMEPTSVGTPMENGVNGSLIAVKRENHGLIKRKQLHEARID